MNYTKQTDWFDIQVDDSSKIITVRQRWLYKWASDFGEKAGAHKKSDFMLIM